MTFAFCPNCAAPLVDSVVDREPRRMCSAACGFVHYDNPTPVVAAIVEHGGAVLLARNRAWRRNFYGLITGFLEQRESPSRCAVREVKEELDLDTVGEPTLIGVYPFEQMNQVIIGYHVVATGAVSLNEELDDYKHVPFEECRFWPAGTGFLLRDWLRTKGYDPEPMNMR